MATAVPLPIPFHVDPSHGVIPRCVTLPYATLQSTFASVDRSYKTAQFAPRPLASSANHRGRALFCFRVLNDATLTQILSTFTDLGVEPILFEELLGIAIDVPMAQRDFPLVALGSLTRLGDDSAVACLDGAAGHRTMLRLLPRKNVWGSWFRFPVYANKPHLFTLL
jgi:hypothetical protein